MTPAARLRLAAQESEASKRTWLAIKARLDWVQEMVDAGIPLDHAFEADIRLQAAKRLPSASRVEACKRIARWLLRRAGR